MAGSVAANARITTSLVVRVLDGNGADWERLMRLYSPSIEQLLARWRVPIADRDALKNEVFAEAFQGLDAFVGQHGSKSFLAWLWTITRRHIRRMIDRDRRRPDRAAGGDRLPSALAELPNEPTVDDRAMVLRALLEHLDLSDDDRRLLNLYHLSDMTAAQVGERFGVSTVAVRQRSARLLRRIREEAADLEGWLDETS